MLKFKLTIILLLASVTATVLYGVLVSWAYFWPVLIILFLLAGAVLFYGSYDINSGFYVKAVSSADTSLKQVAISFDDGPLPSFTTQVLRILKEKNVPATFFCIGKNAVQHPQLLRELHEQGHIIGNHSYSHGKLFDLLSAEKMYTDLQQMNTIVRQEIGIIPALFRPPYGVTNPNLAGAIKRSGFTTVGWSIRSLDTVTGSPDKLMQRVLKQIKPGAVILLHDTCAVTAQVLPALIDALRLKGYDIVPLHKMLNVQPYV